MSTALTALTAETFAELIGSSDQPVLVDFWAPACHPCDLLLPVLEDLAVEQAGRLRVAKVDTHQHPELARRHDVMGTPTLILFRDGEPVRRVVGARGKAYLLEALAEALV